jgi:hypothetical protein
LSSSLVAVAFTACSLSEADHNSISEQSGNHHAELRLPALLALSQMNLPPTKKNA